MIEPLAFIQNIHIKYKTQYLWPGFNIIYHVCFRIISVKTKVLTTFWVLTIIINNCVCTDSKTKLKYIEKHAI